MTERGRIVDATAAPISVAETPRAAHIAGLVFSALFVGSIALLRQQPPRGASATEIQAWYLGGEPLQSVSR